MCHDFFDARFAQQCLDFTDDIGRLVFGAKQWPDDAVKNRVAVAWAKTDAVLFQPFVVESADDRTQRFGGIAQRGL